MVVALSLPLATRVTDVLTGQPTAQAGGEGVAVRNILASEFDTRNLFEMVLTAKSDLHRAGEPGFDQPYASAVDRAIEIADIRSVQDYRNSPELPLVAPDGRTAIALFGFDAADLLAAKAKVRELRDFLDAEEALIFHLSGGPATLQELEEISERDTRRAELFGLPISMLVLIVAFGALVASGLPLLVALTSITISFAALTLLGQVFEFAVFTQSIVTMLGLATGIDYALLMVNRFREELRLSFDPRAAARATSLSAGRAVAFSGLTVVIALTALVIPPLEFIRSMGIGSIVVLTVSVAVATTALPAALALLGHRVNWLKVTRREPGMRTRGFWRRRAELIMQRPWLWAIGGGIALLVMCLPALQMQVADPEGRGLSLNTDARQTVEALALVGLEGLLNPFDVLIDFESRGFFHPSSVRSVSSLVRDLADLDHVAGVYAATSTNLPGVFMYQYFATRETALSSPLADLTRATVSATGRYALVRVFPSGAVTPREGNQLIRSILDAAGRVGVDVAVGGGFVLDREWNEILYRSFPISVVVVYLFTLILLGLAFHSILIPVKSIVLNTLTVGAAYGVITLVFQNGLFSGLIGLSSGLGFVDNSAPLFIFAMVFGLSMDYEVFLVARIYEAHRRGRSDREAVVSALSSTGGVITSAATVMIVVFTLFLFSEVVLIKTLGLGLTVAILLDATMVRVALVPAVMTLAGRWNWWLPKPVARLADRVDLGHD